MRKLLFWFLAAPVLTSCTLIDSRSDEERVWDAASSAERQQWCYMLELAEAKDESLIFILEASGLTLHEATLWYFLLREKCL